MNYKNIVNIRVINTAIDKLDIYMYILYIYYVDDISSVLPNLKLKLVLYISCFIKISVNFECKLNSKSKI